MKMIRRRGRESGEHWMDCTKFAGAALAAIVFVGSWVVPPSLEAQVNNDPAAANTLTIEITGIREPTGKMA